MDAYWIVATTNHTFAQPVINEDAGHVFAHPADRELIQLSLEWLGRVMAAGTAVWKSDQLSGYDEIIALQLAMTAMAPALSVIPPRLTDQEPWPLTEDRMHGH